MKILITKEEIEKRISKMAEEISGLEIQNLVLLVVLKGGKYFGNRLSSAIKSKHKVCTITVTSYDGAKSGKPTISQTPEIKDLRKKNVIIVEDIIDTGNTLDRLILFLQEEYDTKSLRIASLLYKKDNVTLRDNITHYIGFDIPDFFVVGAGMDYKGRHRNLDNIQIKEI